jgi:hypothetical protein
MGSKTGHSSFRSQVTRSGHRLLYPLAREKSLGMYLDSRMRTQLNAMATGLRSNTSFVATNCYWGLFGETRAFQRISKRTVSLRAHHPIRQSGTRVKTNSTNALIRRLEFGLCREPIRFNVQRKSSNETGLMCV